MKAMFALHSVYTCTLLSNSASAGISSPIMPTLQP